MNTHTPAHVRAVLHETREILARNGMGLDPDGGLVAALEAYATSLERPAYCVLVTVTSNPKRTHCLGPYPSPEAAREVVAHAAHAEGALDYYDNGVYTLRVLPLVGGVR